MHRHERTHQREPKPSATAIAALETIERVRLRVGAHAASGIGNVKPHNAIEPLGAHRDLIAALGVPKRIRQQVHQHLRDPRRIGLDHANARIARDLDLHFRIAR